MLPSYSVAQNHLLWGRPKPHHENVQADLWRGKYGKEIRSARSQEKWVIKLSFIFTKFVAYSEHKLQYGELHLFKNLFKLFLIDSFLGQF